MTTTSNSAKERAFLYDLYVTPDWSERIAGFIDEHIKLPDEGRILYVASGTGNHPLAIAARANPNVDVVAIDAEPERTALAQAKQTVVTADADVEFRTAQYESLPFDDAAFDLVIGDLSLSASYRLPEMFAELTRVTRFGGTVALAGLSASSFGEFFSVYWEALAGVRAGEHAAIVETLINELPTATDLEAMAQREGLEEVQSWISREEFEYGSGEEFLSAPLVNQFLLPDWTSAITDDATRDEVREELRRLIDEDHDEETKWTFSVKATLIVGQRGE